MKRLKLKITILFLTLMTSPLLAQTPTGNSIQSKADAIGGSFTTALKTVFRFGLWGGVGIVFLLGIIRLIRAYSQENASDEKMTTRKIISVLGDLIWVFLGFLTASIAFTALFN